MYHEGHLEEANMTTQSVSKLTIRIEEVQREFYDLSKAIDAINEKQFMLYEAIAKNREERRRLLEDKFSLIALEHQLEQEQLKHQLEQQQLQQQKQQQQQRPQQQNISTAATIKTTTTMMQPPAPIIVVRSASGDLYAVPHQSGFDLTKFHTTDASQGLQPSIDPQQLNCDLDYNYNHNTKILCRESNLPTVQKNITNKSKRKANENLDAMQVNKHRVTQLPTTTQPKTIKARPIGNGFKIIRKVSQQDKLPTATQNLKIVEVTCSTKPKKTVTKKVTKTDKIRSKPKSPRIIPKKLEFSDGSDVDIMEDTNLVPSLPQCSKAYSLVSAIGRERLTFL